MLTFVIGEQLCSITTDFIVFVVVIMQHAFHQACIVGSFFANII
jgi:hypothetical protein